MTTFFTVMVMIYAFDGTEVESRLLYTSWPACSSALRQIEQVMDPELEVLQLQCVESNVLSASIRPRGRP